VLSERFLREFLKFIDKAADDTSLARRHRQFTNVMPLCGVNSSKPFLLHTLSLQLLPLPLLLGPDSLPLLPDCGGFNQTRNQIAELLFQLLPFAIAPAFLDRFNNIGRDFETEFPICLKVVSGGDGRIPRTTPLLIGQLNLDLLVVL
jgi:hypothetical protein